jgi:hypothetical protein
VTGWASTAIDSGLEMRHGTSYCFAPSVTCRTV